MIAVDRDALLCDLAETYHIYDLRALPVKILAALCFGLRENSRIKRKIYGVSEVDELALLASIADNLTIIKCTLRGQDLTNAYFVQPDFYRKVKPQKETPIHKFASSEEFKEIWYNG